MSSLNVHYGPDVTPILPRKAYRILLYCSFVPAAPDASAQMPNRWSLLITTDTDEAINVAVFPKNNRTRKAVIVVNTDTPSLHLLPSVGKIVLFFDILKSASLQGVLNAMMERGRDRFMFAAHGRGTRHWIHSVIGDIMGAGYLQPNAWEIVHTTILDAFVGPERRVFCNIISGNFYAEDHDPDTD